MGYVGREINKKHLSFEKLPLNKGKKMFSYKVWNTTLSQGIGTIYFRGGWRQYVFRACADVDMSISCNSEINVFINELMVKWRESLRQKNRRKF